MNPEQWKQVDRILGEALELPLDKREAFLDQVCEGDAELRRDVAAVLQAHGQAGSFLDDPALALAAKEIAADQTTKLARRRLAHYEILSLIGAGGMGEVYRAKDPRLGREVAIKVLPEIFAQNPEALARFEREARAVAALSHPNILAIHDLGTEDGIRYAVMELLDGENLRSRLNRSALTWYEAVEMGCAIADGLAAAHAKHIIHRDLKPENIFLTGEKRIKILDFGLARIKPSAAVPIHAQPSATDLTGPWTVMGTVGYMSPEQVCGQEADAPSDIFSLGCVLHEMVTGKRAFARQTTAETMAAIVRGELPNESEFPSNVPPQLKELIVRCLKRDPAERYQSARDLFYDLNGLLSRPAVSGQISVTNTARQTWPRVLAIFAVILLTTVLGFTWWRSLRPSLNLSRQRLVFASSGTYGAASFSPDGAMIAFTQAVNGVSQVWVKHLSGVKPIQLTFGALAANRPRWSPRNDQIVFSSGKTPTEVGPGNVVEQSIWTVPPLGGTPRPLIENGFNPNWSRDGSKLVFERGTEIWTADPDGTNQRKVEGVPQSDYLLTARMPALSPNASSIAFFQTATSSPLGDFWVIPTSGGQARRLTFDVTAGTSPTWTHDGNFIVFASQRGGSMTLWKIAASGGNVDPVLSGPGEDSDPDISNDGKKLIYRHLRQLFTLTLLDPVTNSQRELHKNADQIVRPSFSPVDDRIVFFSHESDGEIHLSTIKKDGTNLTRVTSGKGERSSFPQWSADGLFLYYYQTVPTMSLRKIPSTGGQSFEIAKDWNRETHYGAQVDPSGERIVYTAMINSRPGSTVVRNIKSGIEEKMEVAFQNPKWSRDGKRIVGHTRTGQREGDVYICPPGPGTCDKLTTGYQTSWFDDSTIYFLRPQQTAAAVLYRIDPRTRVETRVTEIGPLYGIIHMYDVSRQGEIVYIQFRTLGQELWLGDLTP